MTRGENLSFEPARFRRYPKRFVEGRQEELCEKESRAANELGALYLSARIFVFKLLIDQWSDERRAF